ncbi:hypothetical protein Hanom_Chr00s137174g01817681 [Helianthus anomalus]
MLHVEISWCGTSNFNKVSVEVAKEHMELLNTLVSSYYVLLAGQIGNITMTSEIVRIMRKYIRMR